LAFKKEIDDQENSERWLLTYADLITLLLAFFIVMYSMSQIDAKKFGQMKTQLSSILRGGNTIFPKGQYAESDGSGVLKIGDLHMIQKRIRAKFSLQGDYRYIEAGEGPNQKRNIADAVTSEIGERGLTIRIKDYALFESGKADLRAEALDVLEAVANEIVASGNHICIEGHTDNLPISTQKFPSNWELSTARSTSVLRFLVEKKGFSPDKISARGFGEFRPIASNATDVGRSRNRRVDIVLLSDMLSSVEPQPQDHVAESLPKNLQIDRVDTLEIATATPDRLDQ
jgi:chemotaxis protein MotB